MEIGHYPVVKNTYEADVSLRTSPLANTISLFFELAVKPFEN